MILIKKIEDLKEKLEKIELNKPVIILDTHSSFSINNLNPDELKKLNLNLNEMNKSYDKRIFESL
jgi:hypothetical protein